MSGFGPRSCPDCGDGDVKHDDFGCHAMRWEKATDELIPCQCEIPQYRLADYRRSLHLAPKEDIA